MAERPPASSSSEEVGAGSGGDEIVPSALETCRLRGLSSKSELEMSRDDRRMATSNNSSGSDAAYLMSFIVLELKSVGLQATCFASGRRVDRYYCPKNPEDIDAHGQLEMSIWIRAQHLAKYSVVL